MLRFDTGLDKIGIDRLIQNSYGKLAHALQTLYNQMIAVIEIEKVPCPLCGAQMIWWGYYSRIVEFLFRGFKEREKLKIRRACCTHCKHTHAVLPDFLIPYRQESAKWQITIVSEFFKEFPGFELDDDLEQALRKSQAALTDAAKDAPLSPEQTEEGLKQDNTEQCDASEQAMNNTMAGIDFVQHRIAGEPGGISRLTGRLQIEPIQLYYAVGTYIKDKCDWFGVDMAKKKDDCEFLRELLDGNAPKPVRSKTQPWKVPYVRIGKLGKASARLRQFAEANGRSLFTGFRDIRTKAERNALTGLMGFLIPRDPSSLFG